MSNTASMRIGVVLPTFEHSFEPALHAALECEQAGIHGVFAYNHLWPLRHPGQPALDPFPVLAALSQRTENLMIGTLVARIGLVDDDLLVQEFATLHSLSGSRLIAGLGTGDRKSAGENRAYGVAYDPARVRRSSLAHVAAALRELEIPVWIGGVSDALHKIAELNGATTNLWQASAARVAEVARECRVSWAGNLAKTPDAAAAQMAAVRDAGATWGVYYWPGSTAPLLQAAEQAGIAI